VIKIWKLKKLKKKSSKSDEFGPFFSMKNPLNIGRDHIVQVENWQHFTKEKKNTLLVGTINTYVKN
jgi:hypothetical protein